MCVLLRTTRCFPRILWKAEAVHNSAALTNWATPPKTDPHYNWRDRDEKLVRGEFKRRAAFSRLASVGDNRRNGIRWQITSTPPVRGLPENGR